MQKLCKGFEMSGNYFQDESQARTSDEELLGDIEQFLASFNATTAATAQPQTEPQTQPVSSTPNKILDARARDCDD
jgi:hypothetical protein